MRLDQLVKQLKKLKDKGFVPSRRRGPTGVGHTFEAEIGLKESNIPIPDIGGRVEIKAARESSNSLITLFTFNKAAWVKKQDEVIRRFGYEDENGRWALYSTVGINRANPQGLRLSVDETQKYLVLNHAEGEELARWKLSHLVAKFLGKMPRLLLAIAESKVDDSGVETFRYAKAFLCEDSSDDEFVDAILKGAVYVDVRMHLRPDNTVRNHGTAFRVREEKMYAFYTKCKELI